MEGLKKNFQATETMVQILHEEMFQLLKDFMAQFAKPGELKEVSSAKKLLEVDFKEQRKQLDDAQLAIGTETCRVIKEAHMMDVDKKLLYLSFRRFFSTVTEKLIGHLPLNCGLLKDLQFLRPDV